MDKIPHSLEVFPWIGSKLVMSQRNYPNHKFIVALIDQNNNKWIMTFEGVYNDSRSPLITVSDYIVTDGDPQKLKLYSKCGMSLELCFKHIYYYKVYYNSDSCRVRPVEDGS